MARIDARLSAYPVRFLGARLEAGSRLDARLGAHPVPTPRRRGRPPGKASDNDERDRSLYDEYVKGTKLEVIVATLNARIDSREVSWDSIHSRAGITKAVERYCKRWGIPMPEHGDGAVDGRSTPPVFP
jgi:hypothetical protein